MNIVLVLPDSIQISCFDFIHIIFMKEKDNAKCVLGRSG